MKGNTFFKQAISADEFEKIAKYIMKVPVLDEENIFPVPPKDEDKEVYSEPASNQKMEAVRREKEELSDIEETDDELNMKKEVRETLEGMEDELEEEPKKE